MAKFGYLYIREGMYNGQQIVPRQWVQESVTLHSYPEKTDGYGYAWWLIKSRTEIHGKKYQAFLALGYGGQFIWVVPELDIVTVLQLKKKALTTLPNMRRCLALDSQLCFTGGELIGNKTGFAVGMAERWDSNPR